MIFDHERGAESRRGRPVADWGGDDLFTSTPRRRIKPGAPPPRRVSGPATATHAVRREDATLHRSASRAWSQDAAPEVHPLDRLAATLAPEEPADDAVANRPRPAATRAPLAAEDRHLEPGAMPRPAPVLMPEDDATPGTGDAVTVSQWKPPAMPEPADAPVRRTVSITGRPDKVRPVARRPQPTVHDRLTMRPDRIAGWAFGLGITLILIAVGTADAAPL
jgi:hypothetical protein